MYINRVDSGKKIATKITKTGKIDVFRLVSSGGVGDEGTK